VKLAFVITLAAAVLGCAGSSHADVTAPPGLASIRLSPTTLVLDAGAEQQLQAQGLTADGGSVTLSSVQWTAPPEVSLSGTGATVTVRGTKGGRGWIIARSGGFADSVLVDVVPMPVAGNRVLLDLRQSLQQASSIDKAFALFGVVDHTPYRGARNGSGWSFTTNADGKGLHAFRADWSVSPADQGLRVIHYFPAPKPLEVYAQWKGRLGKMATDADANGADNAYAMWPQSNACKRALFDRPDDQHRVDYTLSRNAPEAVKVEMGEFNYARFGDTKVWNPNSAVGGAPFTTTVHVRAATSNTATNGIFQLWVNGVLLVDQHDVPATAEPFDRWSFPETCVLVPQPQSEYFWDLLVWTP